MYCICTIVCHDNLIDYECQIYEYFITLKFADMWLAHAYKSVP